MLDHHIERSILNKLALSDSLTFSELRPDDLDNKLFDYHLKIVIREKLVEKTSSGRYKLSATGKRAWKLASSNTVELATRAFSLLILVVQNDAGQWLLYTRNTQPLKGLSGFMHTYPSPGQSVFVTAQRNLLSKTGLSAEFDLAGNGFTTMYTEGELESYTHFVLLYGKAKGSLTVNDAHATYTWVNNPLESDVTLLPNMPALVDALSTLPRPFFIESTYELPDNASTIAL